MNVTSLIDYLISIEHSGYNVEIEHSKTLNEIYITLVKGCHKNANKSSASTR